MKPFYFVLLLSTAVLSACDSASDKEQPAVTAVATPNPTATTPPTPVAAPLVTAVSACTKLTIEEVTAVYSDKKFKIEVDRNDPPTPYEALSACRYQEEGKEVFDQYFVDLEVRARPQASEALQMLQEAKATDFDKKGKDVVGFGDSAYYFNYQMQDGGPSLAFVKDNVYYKLTVQTIHSGAFTTIESEIMALAKKILE